MWSLLSQNKNCFFVYSHLKKCTRHFKKSYSKTNKHYKITRITLKRLEESENGIEWQRGANQTS